MLRTTENREKTTNFSENDALKLFKELVFKLNVQYVSLKSVDTNVKHDPLFATYKIQTITYTNVDVTSASFSRLVKCAPNSKYIYSILPIRSFFERETYMYTNVLPEIKKIKMKKAEKEFNFYPKFIKCELYPKEYIVINNMQHNSYFNKSCEDILDYEHVMLAVKELSNFHGLSYVLRKENSFLYSEIHNNLVENFYTDIHNNSLDKYGINHFVKIAMNTLRPETDAELINSFENIERHMKASLIKLCKAGLGKETSSVICHGDFNHSNLFFKYKQQISTSKIRDKTNISLVPTELCVINWNFSKMASPVIDLSVLLFTSTDSELRKVHYNTFISEYYSSLSNFLKMNDLDINTVLPNTVFRNHLKTYSFYGLYRAFMTLYIKTAPQEDVPDFGSAANEQDLIKMFQFQNTNFLKFNERMRHIIVDFCELGYNFRYM